MVRRDPKLDPRRGRPPQSREANRTAHSGQLENGLPFNSRDNCVDNGRRQGVVHAPGRGGQQHGQQTPISWCRRQASTAENIASSVSEAQVPWCFTGPRPAPAGRSPHQKRPWPAAAACRCAAGVPRGRCAASTAGQWLQRRHRAAPPCSTHPVQRLTVEPAASFPAHFEPCWVRQRTEAVHPQSHDQAGGFTRLRYRQRATSQKRTPKACTASADGRYRTLPHKGQFSCVNHHTPSLRLPLLPHSRCHCPPRPRHRVRPLRRPVPRCHQPVGQAWGPGWARATPMAPTRCTRP